MITVIFGRSSSGKTYHKQAFKKHYGCKRIVDGWSSHHTNHPLLPLRDGDLVLTNEMPPYRGLERARVIPIGSAKRDAGVLQ